MTNDEYIDGITTIISNFRRAELGNMIDSNHVRRWVSQFEPNERSTVLSGTFHILERYYYNSERIYTFLDCVIKVLTTQYSTANIVFVDVQKKGRSQKLIHEYIRKKGDFVFQSENFIDTSKHYVYIDDCLYSGGRTREDLIFLIDQLPSNSSVEVCHMLAYSRGWRYTKRIIEEKAADRNIHVEFNYGKMYLNDRADNLEKYDFLWPDAECKKDNEVASYLNRLLSTQKAKGLFNKGIRGAEIFSSDIEYKELTTIFLRYGIKIIKELHDLYFTPLGVGFPLSFGFGALCVTDWNIANNCPLVLWWGNNENPNAMVGGWYPLLPRRGNDTLYKEMYRREIDSSIKANTKMLNTVYCLSVEEKDENKKTWDEVLNMFDPYAPSIARKKSNLYQYLNSCEFDKIKLIQSVMYIGRNYDFDRFSNDEETVIDSDLKRNISVPNPDEVVQAWLMELTWSKGWNAKSIEIEQIYQKKNRLSEYLKRAFMILGVDCP